MNRSEQLAADILDAPPAPRAKMVIVVRKDLKMRLGKAIAQGAHAAMKHLLDLWVHGVRPAELPEAHRQWYLGNFRKICCSVDSDAALVALQDLAEAKGLTVYLITDQGLTEFHGVPTRTCLAIGPAWDSEFVGVTDQLPLL